MGVFSNYMWRGQKLSKGPVIQPSVGITYGNFGANLWTNYDMDSEEHNETDLTLSYGFSMDKMSLESGSLYYALDGSDSGETQEIYLSVAYEVLFNPVLTVYYDFDEGDGTFINTAIGHTFEFSRGIAGNLGANAGYNINNKGLGTDKNGDVFSSFYNGEITASLTIPWKDVAFEPVIAYTFPLSSKAKEAIEEINFDGDSRIVYGGVTLSLSF